MEKLKVNDKVSWRGSWGKDAPQEAKVIGINLNDRVFKDGQPLTEVEWYIVQEGRNIVVSLDNGHWAYGNQLSPIE